VAKIVKLATAVLHLDRKGVAPKALPDKPAVAPVGLARQPRSRTAIASIRGNDDNSLSVGQAFSLTSSWML